MTTPNQNLKVDTPLTVGVFGINSDSNEAQVKADDKEQFDSYIKKGDLAWAKARKLIALANEQDEFPGGIEASGLREIYDAAVAHLPPANKSKSLEGAKIYYRYAIATFQKMLGEYSGYATVIERSQDIGCSYERNPLHGQFCPPGSTQEESSYLKITCADIGAEKIIKDRFVNCRIPSWMSCGHNCDQIGHRFGEFPNRTIIARDAANPDQWFHCLCPIPPYEK